MLQYRRLPGGWPDKATQKEVAMRSQVDEAARFLARRRVTRRQAVVRLAAAGVAAPLAASLATRAAAAQEGTPEATPLAFNIDEMPLKNPGRLTVHADQPLYEPWFIDNDPTNGEGFESALVYALAEEMGFARDEVDWGYTAFNASYAPGPKDFDFYITEVSITEPRKEAVSFSDGYYSTPFVIIAPDGSEALQAESLEDLRQYRFGTLVNSSYATYITDVIQPEPEMFVFNTNAEALQALVNEQVDVNVESLDIALQVVSEEQFPELDIAGILPGPGTELGMVFEKDSALVPYINQALANLRADGTLERLEEEWLPPAPELREIAE
jgi:polar amino acid transport system substrate-binding protein